MSMHPAGEAYTLQDYLQWEGDWELIRGQPVAMVPSPSFEHQQVSAAIFRQLDESLDDCPHCQTVFEMDVEFAQDTVVRPDVLVICYQPEGALADLSGLALSGGFVVSWTDTHPGSQAIGVAENAHIAADLDERHGGTHGVDTWQGL